MARHRRTLLALLVLACLAVPLGHYYHRAARPRVHCGSATEMDVRQSIENLWASAFLGPDPSRPLVVHRKKQLRLSLTR